MIIPIKNIFKLIVCLASLLIVLIVSYNVGFNQIYQNSVSKIFNKQYIKGFLSLLIKTKFLTNSVNCSYIYKQLKFYYICNMDTFLNFSKIINASNIDWPIGSNYEVLDAHKLKYFEKVFKKTNITTMIIWINYAKYSNILNENYYHYSSNDCSTLLKKANHGPTYSEDHFNTSCMNNSTLAFTKSLKLSKKLFMTELKISERNKIEAFHKLPEEIPTTYFHIIKNAYANTIGDVWFSKFKIKPMRSGGSGWQYPKNIHESKIYDKVFIVTQYWANAYYHFLVEDAPKLMYFISWLQRHTEYKIYVRQHNYSKFLVEFFAMLNISMDRLIFDSHIRAKILIFPDGESYSVYGLNLLSKNFRKLVKDDEPDNLIVIIKRSSSSRQWRNHDKIYKAVNEKGLQYGLKTVVFGDKPSPSFIDTVKLFSKAKIIIGPHGAGLSNMVWANNSTFIVEGLCNTEGYGRPNTCFRNIAQVLGLRWYGIYSKNDCLQTKAEDVITAMENVFKLL